MMSLSLDINNFHDGEAGGGYSKLPEAIYSDLDNLQTVNKGFLENPNFDLVEPIVNTHHQQQFLSLSEHFFTDDLLFKNNSNHSNDSNNKNSEIENLNVYNSVLLNNNNSPTPGTGMNITNSNEIQTNEKINNTSKSNLLQMKLSTAQNKTKNCNNFGNISDKIHQNNILHLNKFNITSERLTECNSLDLHLDKNYQYNKANRVPDKRRRSTKRSLSKPKSPELNSELKLLFCHGDELKPIIFPAMKSGVYRKLCAPKTNLNDSNNKKSNVCLSTSDNFGKIMTIEEFRKNYIEEKYENSKNVEILEQNNLISNSFENNFKEQIKQNKRPKSHLQSNLKSVANKMLNLPSENVTVDKKKNEIIYKNPIAKKRLRYRLLQPQYFNDLVNLNNHENGDKSLINNCSNQNLLRKTTRRGRPKKIVNNSTTVNSHHKQESKTDNQQEQKTSVSFAKTRYGRVSKLPSYIQDFKIFISETNKQQSKFSELRNELTDKDYRCNQEITNKDENIQQCNFLKLRKRNIPPEYQCRVCNKIFLGKRMQKHYESHPDHNVNGEHHKFITETSLYKFLVKKIKLSTSVEGVDNRTDIFLKEISDFLQQLQMHSSRFVRNTTGTGTHFINSHISKVFGIPDGHYHIDLDDIDSPTYSLVRSGNDETSNFIESSLQQPRLDYNLSSISLDDTIVDAKLNMITSDDSLLRTVNDLMEESIKNLTENNNHHHHIIMESNDSVVHHSHQTPMPIIHYDHATDNAVEAASIKDNHHQPSTLLDLSLDLFQFNSN